jgi:opacity protein-like surface antigen
MISRWIQFAAALAVAGLSAAAAAQMQAPDRPLKFVFQAGLTGGGDNLATVYYNHGGSRDIRAGGLVHLAAGVLWQPEDAPFSWQLTYGYHFDDASDSNTTTRFSRYPLEVLGFYNGVSRWRFGGGLRFVNSAQFKDDYNGIDLRFGNTTGVVAEIGYNFGRALWLSGRLVAEKYSPKSLNGVPVQGSDVNGDHAGIYFTAGF